MKKNIWAIIFGLLIISSTFAFVQVPNKKEYLLDIFSKKDIPKDVPVVDTINPINIPTQEINYNKVKTDNDIQILKARISALEFQRKKDIQLAFLNSEDGCKNTASTTFKTFQKSPNDPNVERYYTSHWNTKQKSCLMEISLVWKDASDSNHMKVRIIYYNATKGNLITECTQEGYINPERIIKNSVDGCDDSIFLLFKEGLMTD